jgi:Ferritin-like domain
MKSRATKSRSRTERRSFIKHGMLAASGATVGLGLLGNGKFAFGDDQGELGGGITNGDAAILRFLAAAEILETDLWLQYAELGGTQDNLLPGLPTGGSAPYTAALANIDADMAQYIHDNTDDEMSHETFINAYLVSKGEDPVNLDQFRTLPSSRATGANQIGRLTNLMQLTVDTSWYTRYRSRTNNPDLDPGLQFPQAVPSLSSGQFPAIPITDADLTPSGHIQAIANTAAFHFCLIEQGGTSLYPTLAQKVTNLEALRVVLSIGPTEAMHFQTWHDKAGNAVSDPLAPLTDPTNPELVFPNLNAQPFGGALFQTNLIMPEPCPFLSRKLPVVSIVRPTSTRQGGAVAAATALTNSGLFIGQSKEFFELLTDLANEADSARRGS